MSKPSTARVGVISDTHGLMRPQALDVLRGSDLILHAGDIGTSEVLDALRALAPVIAVRGNNDHGDWARAIREREMATVAGRSLYLLHDFKELGFDPLDRDYRVIVAGHSHKPSVREHDGVLLLNPGSAGPRRFKLPISVAILDIGPSTGVKARLVELAV